jgi:universal stress protein A
LQGAIRNEARGRLDKLVEQLGLFEEQVILAKGSPSDEIHDAVKDKDIDLILIGTHGQKGLRLLLGSTANSVLHGVRCDVLTVRL